MRERIDENKNDKIFSTWIQKLEQNIKSIEKRLDAVERRLSMEKFETAKLQYSEKEMEDMGRNEIIKIKDKIKSIEKKIEELEKKEPITISLKKKSTMKKDDSQNLNFHISDLRERLNKLENRNATVKTGGIEFPVEITGIVGGILAIITAIILLSGHKNIISTPSFVFAVGLILLISAGLKMYVTNKNAYKNQ